MVAVSSAHVSSMAMMKPVTVEPGTYVVTTERREVTEVVGDHAGIRGRWITMSSGRRSLPFASSVEWNGVFDSASVSIELLAAPTADDDTAPRVAKP